MPVKKTIKEPQEEKKQSIDELIGKPVEEDKPKEEPKKDKKEIIAHAKKIIWDTLLNK